MASLIRSAVCLAEIQIVFAADRADLGAGLRALLPFDSRGRAVAQVRSAPELLRAVAQLNPEIVLLSPRFGDGRLQDLLRQIARLGTRARVLLLAEHIALDALSEAIRLGVCGLISPKSGAPTLLACLTAVERGELWLARHVLTDLVRRLSAKGPYARPKQATAAAHLTIRQRDVLRLIFLGYCNKEIAGRLDLSRETVKHHLTAIFEKTALRSRLELALFAAQYLPEVAGKREGGSAARARPLPQRRTGNSVEATGQDQM